MKTLLKIFKNIFELPLFLFGFIIGLYFLIEYSIKTKKEEKSGFGKVMYIYGKTKSIVYSKNFHKHYAAIICFSFWLIIFWLIIM